MAWEKHLQSGRSIKPKMTIRKGGQIGVNNSAITKYGLKDFKYVVLYIDKMDKKIGLKPTNDEKEEGVKVFKTNKYGASIPAKSFVDDYGLEQIKKRQLDCLWDKKDSMLVAKYSE